MSIDNLDLRIRVGADTGAGERGLRRVSEAAGATDRAISGLSRGMLTLAASAAGIGSVGSAFARMVSEADQVQRHLLRTDALIAATGATAGYTAKQLYEQARALAYATLQSTEGVQEAQGVLLTFKSIAGETFERTIEMAADMSTVLNQSLTGSVKQLAKALEDPVAGLSALRRASVSFTDEQKALIKSLVDTNQLAKAQSEILDVLAGQMGGVARREAEGYSGAIDTLGQKWQDLFLVLERKMDTLERATNLVSRFSNLIGAATNYIDGLGFQNLDSEASQVNVLLQQRIELQQSYRDLQSEINELAEDGVSWWERFDFARLSRELQSTSQQWGEVELRIRGIQDANVAAVQAAQTVADVTGEQAEKTEKLTAAQQRAAEAVQDYADRASSVLGLTRKQRDTLADLLPNIDAMANKYGVAREVIVGLIDQESGFNRLAKSAAGAVGLMQIMPGTAKQIAREIGVSAGAIYSDLNTHIEAGTYYLAKYIEQFGSLEEGLRAYNAGPGAVDRSYGFKETNEYVERVTANIEALIPISGQAGSALKDQLGAGANAAAKEYDRLAAAGDDARTILSQLASHWDSLADQYGTAYAAQRRFRDDLNDVSQLLATGRMSASEYAAAVADIRLEYQRSKGPVAEWLADMEESIGTFGDFAADALDSFTDTLADSLRTGRFEFRDFVDDIGDMLAELAAKKIVVSIAGSITGVSGLAATSGAAASTTGTTSAVSGLGSIGSIGSWLTSGSLGVSAVDGINTAGSWFGADSLLPSGAASNLYGASNFALGGSAVLGSLFGSALFGGGTAETIGSSIGSTAGTVIGTAIAGPIGGVIGSLLGGGSGGFLGSLFGDAEPRFGGYATSFSGTGFEDNVSARGSFGLSFGVSDKGTKGIDAAQYQETLNGLATVSDYLSSFFGSEISSIVAEGLQGVLGNFNDWGNDLDSYFSSLFGTIINLGADAVDGGDDVGSALAAAMQGLGGLGGSTQQMASQIEDGIAVVRSAAALFGTQFGDLLGFGAGGVYDDISKASAALGGYVAEFRVGTESASEAIARITTDAVALTTAMGIAGQSLQDFTGSGYDFIAAATGFVDKLGYYGSSIETLASQQDAYYSAFFTDEERATIAREAAQAQVNGFNASLGLSGAAAIESGADLRRFVEGLDLTTDAGQDAYIQAMQTVGAFQTLATTLVEVVDTAAEAAIALEQSLDAIWQAIAPDDYSLAQVESFRAGLEGVGLSSGLSADALLELVKAGALSAEQIDYLSANLGTLGDWADGFATVIEDTSRAVVDSTAEIEAALNGWRLGTAFDWQADLERRTINYQYKSKALLDDAYLAQVMHAYDRHMQWFNAQLRKYGKASTQYAETLSNRILDLVTTNFFDLYLSKFDLSIGDAAPANALGVALGNLSQHFEALGKEVPVTAEQFAEMWAALKASPLSRDSIYSLGLIAQNLDSLDTVFARVADFVGWLGLETSALNNADAAREQLTALFDSFGLAVPQTKEALAELVNAGTLTNAQLLALAQNQGYLETYFSAVSDDVTQAAQEMESALQSLSDMLLSAADSLLAQTSSATIGRRADAQIMLERALDEARTSGLLPNPDDFQAVADALTADATSGYASRSEYLADQARIRAMLLELEGYTRAGDATALTSPAAEIQAPVPVLFPADQQREETAKLTAALADVRAELAAIKLESRAQHAESARLQRRTADTLESWDIEGMPAEATA